MPGPDPRLPVDVPSGVLGAGKAARLSRERNDREGRRVAVTVGDRSGVGADASPDGGPASPNDDGVADEHAHRRAGGHDAHPCRGQRLGLGGRARGDRSRSVQKAHRVVIVQVAEQPV